MITSSCQLVELVHSLKQQRTPDNNGEVVKGAVVFCIFQRVCPFHPCFLIYWQNIVQNTPLIFLKFLPITMKAIME